MQTVKHFITKLPESSHLKASCVKGEKLFDGFHLNQIGKLVDECFGDLDSARVTGDVKRGIPSDGVRTTISPVRDQELNHFLGAWAEWVETV